MAVSSHTNIVSPYCIRVWRLGCAGHQANVSKALIKGFAARVSEVTLNKIAELTEAYAPYIEEDFVVKIDGSSGSPQ